MREFVRVRIDGGVQPELLAVDLGHCLVERTTRWTTGRGRSVHASGSSVHSDMLRQKRAGNPMAGCTEMVESHYQKTGFRTGIFVVRYGS